MYEIDKVSYEIAESKTKNEYSLKLSLGEKSLFVLSKYKPKEQLSNTLNFTNVNRSTVFILFGYGFGYLAQQIIDTVGKGATILVIEPSAKLLKEQRAVNDIKGITYLTEQDDLTQTIKSTINSTNYNDLYMVKHPHYEVFYGEYLKMVLNAITEVKRGIEVDINTIKVIDSKFIENSVVNSKYINSSFDFTIHKDKYKNIPAVVVSAGPSLDKNLDDLKGFKGLIFSGGRTLNTVNNIGMPADFACVADYSEKVRDTFGENITTPLIAMINASQQVVADAQNARYFVEYTPIAQELIGKPLPSVTMGGSVATLCMDAARYMGCNPVIFIGQDLAYDNDKMYSKSCNIFEDTAHNNDMKFIPAYNGGKVKSTDMFIAFLRWIENYISENSDTTYINATEGGAKIAGTIQMPLKEVVEKYSTIEKPAIEHVKLNYPIDINDALNVCLNNLQEAKKLTARAVEVSENLYRQYQNYHAGKSPIIVKRLVASLDEFDAKLKNGNIMAIVGYMFANLSRTISVDSEHKDMMGRSDLDNAKGIAHGNLKLYKALELTIDNIINIIKEELTEMLS